MTINITFKGMDSSEAIKSYASERVKKLYKFLPPTTVLNAVLGKDRRTQVAEVTFSYNGEPHHASKEGEDIYEAIDGVVDKAVQQLRRAKEKRTER